MKSSATGSIAAALCTGAGATALCVALLSATPAGAQISDPQAAAASRPAEPAEAAQRQAQPQPSPAQAKQQTAASTDNQGVADIVVTAQFREQNLQDVPISISAVSGEQLLQRSVTNLTDVARSVPNVEMQQGNSGYGSNTNQAYIRGLGQVDFLATFEPRVGFYIDDVYFATTFGAVFDVLDLERVEVLRGPQGTLFGRNSVGGAIRIISRKPQGDGSGYVEATYGNYNRYQVRGAVDIGLVQDVLALRLTGSAKGQDGFVDLLDYKCVNPTLGNNNVGGLGQGSVNDSCKRSTLGGTKNYNVRGSLRFQPSSDWNILLQADYLKEESESPAETIVATSLSLDNPESRISGGAARAGQSRDFDNGLARYLRGLGTSYYGFNVSTPALMQQVAQSFVSPTRTSTYASYGNARVGYRNPPQGDFKAYGGSLNIDGNLTQDLHLTSITAYRKVEGVFGQSLLALPVEEVRQSVSSRQFSQEVRLLGNFLNGFLDFTLGAFYINTAGSNPSRVQTEGFTNALDFFGDDRNTLKAWAAFGAVDLHPIENLTISGGLRYSDERKTYTFNRDYSPSGLSAINFTFVGRSHDTRFNPRVAVNYEFSDALNVYGSYSTGFTAAGFNARPFGPTSVFALEPENVKAYEIGFKSDFFDRRARLNAAIYQTEFGNIIGTTRGDVTSRCPGAPFCNDNIGDARIRGFEAELQTRPADGLQVSANVGYTRFKYQSLSAIVQGLTLDSPNTRVPNWNASGSIQYDAQLGNGGKITPRVDVSYRSRIYFNTSRANVSAQQDPYALVNARLTYTMPGENWSISVAATNLLDKFYYTTLTDQRESFGFLSGTVGRPREILATVRHNF
jgi:iron complex outermembrane receptor protein